MKVTLKPGEGAEVKAVMTKDARLTYSWKSEGGTVNHDTHGEPTGNPVARHAGHLPQCHDAILQQPLCRIADVLYPGSGRQSAVSC
ncbi:hypothetical protein [Azospirillum sp. A23]|uniref:hypothetical protein n=1 Tax=Azospirillum sp. A23 TaxID=3160608 RepID=UPI0036F38DC6